MMASVWGLAEQGTKRSRQERKQDGRDNAPLKEPLVVECYADGERVPKKSVEQNTSSSSEQGWVDLDWQPQVGESWSHRRQPATCPTPFNPSIKGHTFSEFCRATLQPCRTYSVQAAPIPSPVWLVGLHGRD
jgi:hypothetical protein